MTKLPCIVKPRPVKWGKPIVYGDSKYGFWVQVFTERGSGADTQPEARADGPVRKTRSAAIRAWNKQEGKP